MLPSIEKAFFIELSKRTKVILTLGEPLDKLLYKPLFQISLVFLIRFNYFLYHHMKALLLD